MVLVVRQRGWPKSSVPLRKGLYSPMASASHWSQKGVALPQTLINQSLTPNSVAKKATNARHGTT